MLFARLLFFIALFYTLLVGINATMVVAGWR